MRTQLTITFSILAFLAVATVLVIAYGKGYRLGFDRGKLELSGTGILVATSVPNGAQVFINDHLQTATDDTINLFPADYTVRITKEGYFPWEKKLKVQKEIVAKADATLFAIAPKLESITSSGVTNPVLDPSGSRIAYTVASSSAQKNGVYVLDMTNRSILTLQSASTQIIDESFDAFATSTLSWSPDGQELLATVSAKLHSTTYLLKANGFNENPQNVSNALASVKDSWDKERLEKDTARMEALKKPTQALIASYFSSMTWSADETRVLYIASQSGTLPLAITPRLPGIEATPEQRTITKGNTYVYDTKEDKNYDINSKLETRNSKQIQNANTQSLSDFDIRISNLGLSWLPDSRHLLLVQDHKIEIVEYDGQNLTTIYAGPFVDGIVYPWPTGSKLVILTNLGNSITTPNLYTISLQ